MDELEAIFSLEENEITADFSLTDEDNLDAIFKIDAAGTTWGSIDGNISNQTDLQNELNTLSGQIEGNHSEITNIQTTMQGYGDIVTHNVTEFATATQGDLANTALQPGDNITELVNNAGYITGIDYTAVTTALGYTPQPELTEGYGINISGNTISTDTTIASKTDIGSANLVINRNNTPVGTFSANATEATTVTINVPTTATEVGALPSDTTINDLTTTEQQAALNSGATSTNIGQISTNTSAIATNTSAISTINGKIPSQATSSNQLADKSFVNSSIATNTANFIGTFNSVAELEAYSGTVTNNDYAFVATTDTAGNTLYDRYKYTTATTPAEWEFEYELNNSSFTSDQWAAINSGVTSSDVTLISTATQPGDNVSTLVNDAGYLTSASVGNGPTVFKKNGTAFATITANQTSTVNINYTIPTTASDVHALPDTTTIGAGNTTITVNSTSVGTINANQTSSGSINISVPTNNNQLTNGAGYITSSALNDYVDKTTAQTITNTKTFKTSSFGTQIVVNRDSLSGDSAISYQTQGTLIGRLGIESGTSRPKYWNASGTAQLLVRQKTLGTAQGSATQPVYIDANGVAQTCNTIPDTSTLANKDLSNLTSTGGARLHALKGYLDEGELLTDAEGFADVNKYAHSTFDVSKFTVVGSPNITSDGILTNYGKNISGVQTPFVASDFYDKDYEILTPAFPARSAIGTGVIQMDVYGNGGFFSFWAHQNSISWHVRTGQSGSHSGEQAMIIDTSSIPSGTLIQAKMQYTHATGTYTLSYREIDGGEWQGATSYVATTPNTNIYVGDATKKLNIGTLLYNTTKQEPLYLSYFKISMNGIPVFSGNKTGIDTIKPDNYTITGTPTISADGVASGFSSSNYLTNSTIIDTTKSWKAQLTLTTPTLGTSQVIVQLSQYFYLVFSSTKQLSFRTTDNTQSNWITSTDTFLDNTEYTVEFGWDGSKIFLNYKPSNGSWINKSGYPGAYSGVSNATIESLGFGQSSYPFNGSIDLNSFNVYVNGDLVYQPCLKIPYTQSKTGSKIVDSAYRNRVSDMYGQFGYAPYYTLLEGTNYTIPQGEVYGMLQSYSDGEIVYTNQTILDGVSLNGSTNLTKTVTLPNDGYDYMVYFRGSCTTPATNQKKLHITLSGNVVSGSAYCAASWACGNFATTFYGSCAVPMKYGSDNLSIYRSTAMDGTATLVAVWYRRMGKNK